MRVKGSYFKKWFFEVNFSFGIFYAMSCCFWFRMLLFILLCEYVNVTQNCNFVLVSTIIQHQTIHLCSMVHFSLAVNITLPRKMIYYVSFILFIYLLIIKYIYYPCHIKMTLLKRHQLHPIGRFYTKYNHCPLNIS